MWNGELMNEAIDRGMKIELGKEKNREDIIKIVDGLRRNEIYPHTMNDCNEECLKRGCQSLRVIDGCWKLCFPHCMYTLRMEVKGYPLLNFPDVCTNPPANGEVFCTEHLEFLKNQKIPTKKQAFLEHIGCKGNPQSEQDIKAVDDGIRKLAAGLSNPRVKRQVAYSKGVQQILEESEPSTLNERASEPSCNKDTGQKSRLRQRSRGVFAAVSGGGNFLYFNPLFKSESPSQAFMLTINMIYQELRDVPKDQQLHALESYVLSYDNMCHLDSLKAAKEDLPLPAPFNKMWGTIKKVIDRLHLANHKDPRCKLLYNPDSVLDSDKNTMAGEQAFSWLAKFKKVVNSMSQVHHLFFLHRMIKRRNAYTSRCRRRNVAPVFPGINKPLLKKCLPNTA